MTQVFFSVVLCWVLIAELLDLVASEELRRSLGNHGGHSLDCSGESGRGEMVWAYSSRTRDDDTPFVIRQLMAPPPWSSWSLGRKENMTAGAPGL